ncbi:MAG: winged helix-turn-helix domain-containing protein [Desulfurococcales archaeon]|nr:winged helix-turn-helix domain-containing protein [Desulfurococcales archaeon]
MESKGLMPVRLEEAKALSDELRLIILEIIEREPMSVLEIVDELKKRGIVKTPNTIRYHLAVLKDAGLVELVKVGKTYKYAAKGKFYAYTGSGDVDEVIERLALEVKGDVEAIARRLLEEHWDEIVEAAKKLKPCEFCVTKHFVEQVIYEIFKKAIALTLAELHVKDTDKEEGA